MHCINTLSLLINHRLRLTDWTSSFIIKTILRQHYSIRSYHPIYPNTISFAYTLHSIAKKTMPIEYLTPKPTAEEYMLPVCPPPPTLPHKALVLTPFDDNDTLPDLSIGKFLFGTGKNSSPIPLSLERSYGGISTTLGFRLKPRPSKYSPPLPPVDTFALQSMKRSASSQQIYLMSRKKKSNLTRSPSFSRAA
jgi:hypothetical protein